MSKKMVRTGNINENVQTIANSALIDPFAFDVA
jgi:hypothetical protein